MKNIFTGILVVIGLIVLAIFGVKVDQMRIERVVNKMIDEKKISCPCGCSTKQGEIKMNKKITKIIYIAGVVIDNKELLTLVNKNYPNTFCHHMTIQFNNGDLNTIPDFIGREFNFMVNTVFEDEKAMAVTGEPNDTEILQYMQNINQKPHITICTGKDIKPVYSNTLISSGSKNKPVNMTVKMRVGAFCSFEDGTTDWIYELN